MNITLILDDIAPVSVARVIGVDYSAMHCLAVEAVESATVDRPGIYQVRRVVSDIYYLRVTQGPGGRLAKKFFVEAGGVKAWEAVLAEIAAPGTA